MLRGKGREREGESEREREALEDGRRIKEEIFNRVKIIKNI